MLDFGIDCQQSADEFILTDRRYDEGHGAFHNLAVGEGDGEPMCDSTLLVGFISFILSIGYAFGIKNE